MAKRYTHSTTITVELAGGCLGQRVPQPWSKETRLQRAPTVGGTPSSLVNKRSLSNSTASCLPAGDAISPKTLIIIIARNKSNIDAARTRS
jgi:hypothetical protein